MSYVNTEVRNIWPQLSRSREWRVVDVGFQLLVDGCEADRDCLCSSRFDIGFGDEEFGVSLSLSIVRPFTRKAAEICVAVGL